MNGPIAQSVSIVIHGNAFLNGSELPRYEQNSTFAFCEKIVFVKLETGKSGGPREAIYAENPKDWYRMLLREHCSGLRLSFRSRNKDGVPDRMLAGFVGGGGDRFLETIMPGGSDLWAARWEVGDKNAKDRRIWRVAYGCVAKADTQASSIDLHKRAAELRGALSNCRLFAEGNDLDNFARCFRNAIETIESKGEKRYGFHKDLAVESTVSLLAEILLDACQSAWVFGGMGSWNDLYFEGESMKKYNELSERLYQAVNNAIVDAANESCRTKPG